MLEQIQSGIPNNITINRLSVIYHELKKEISHLGYQTFEEFKCYINDADDPLNEIHELQVRANRR